jgi:NitT/TauT family transport system substrate-binding protein
MLKRTLTLLIALVCFVGAACSSGGSGKAATKAQAGSASTTSPDAQPLASPVNIKVGLLPNVAAAALYVAQGKGYFKDVNLNVSIVPIPGTEQAQPLLATGSLDAQLGGVSAAFFNGISNGLDVKLVAGWGDANPASPSAAFVTLKGGPIKSVADLRGKKVASNGGTASVSGFFLHTLLKQANMTVNDVRVVDLGVPDGLAALQHGSVVAAISAGPLLTKAITDGSQIFVGDPNKVFENGSLGGVIFGTNLLKKNRAAGVAFLRALLKATDTDLQGDYRTNPEIVKILADGLQVASATITGPPPDTYDPTMRLLTAVYDDMQTFWHGQGSVLTYSKNLTTDQLFDGRFLQLALQK